MDERQSNWIQTYTGVKFYPLEPRAREVRILDIAHALSNLCRFTGHVRSFYSVAEHSVLVSRVCAPEDALWGLLHDAPEAYLADMARPVKHSDEMYAYREAEGRLMDVVCKRFHLEIDMPTSVAAADDTLLFTEKRDLMSKQPAEWSGVVPSALHLDLRNPLTPGQAKSLYLARFAELLGQRHYRKLVGRDVMAARCA